MEESSNSFPVELETGEVVRIVDKQPDPQIGAVLIAEDGRVVKDDYNTLSLPYEAEAAPETEAEKKTAKETKAKD